MNADTLGGRIRALRRKRRLAQVDLAAACGVLRPVVCRWETDVHRPAFRHLTRLAAALEVSLDELIRGCAS